VKNGQKLQKKWPEIVKKCRKWPEIVKNCQKMAKNCRKKFEKFEKL
jgi:hypothetical protein